MQQLTGLDAAFLALEEQSGTYGHVGSVCTLDVSTAHEELTLDRLTRFIESRLPLVPPFRRRLVQVPLGLDQPYWIDDPCFDIEFHVRELALAPPGNDQQLAEQAARLHSRPLDRSRPLWELYLIHGLEGGRKAIYTKVHHAAIDGVSGADILAAVVDLTPEGREVKPEDAFHGEQPPSTASMLLRSAVSLASHPVRLARMAPGLARAVPTLAGSVSRPRIPLVDRLTGYDGRDPVLPNAGLRAPATPFNKPITQHRRWAFRSMPFEDFRAIKNAADCTVNDVVMAICAGALRAWLLEHDALPDSPLIAAVPVSVRTAEEHGQHGNKVSSLIAPIPTNLEDPLERLQATHKAMDVAKQQHGALPANLLADVTQFAMPALAGQATRLAAQLRLLERVSPFNLFISNVPGPMIPLYYAGARLEGYYPLSAIADGQGLNITVMSFDQGIHAGLIADRELIPGLELMADAMVEELATLKKLTTA